MASTLLCRQIEGAPATELWRRSWAQASGLRLRLRLPLRLRLRLRWIAREGIARKSAHRLKWPAIYGRVFCEG
jgi:hypothetical protein